MHGNLKHNHPRDHIVVHKHPIKHVHHASSRFPHLAWCVLMMLILPKKTSNTQLLWMIYPWTCVPPSSPAASEYNWDMHAFKAPTKITGMAQHPSSSLDSFIYHEQCFLECMGLSKTWDDLSNLIMGTCLITGTLITNGLYLLELSSIRSEQCCIEMVGRCFVRGVGEGGVKRCNAI